MLSDTTFIGLFCILLGFAICDGFESEDVAIGRRFVRATDEQLSTAVEHLQAIARITTGIALQTALIDGKQNSDELISELLLLGKVTPSQLTSMDGNELLNTLTSLKDLPDQLVDSGDVKKIEEKLEKMEEVRKLVEKAGGGSEWVGKTEFMAEMEKVKKDGVNLTTVASAYDAIKEWNSAMGNVTDLATKSQDYSTYIDSLKDNSGKILEKAKELDRLTAYSPKYFTIESAKKSLDPLSKLIEIVKKSYDMASNTSSSANEATDFVNIQNNIRQLADLSASLGSVVPDIQTIQNVLKSRDSPIGQSLKYPGFTNGFHDLETIFHDLGYDWVRKVVDRERLNVALKPIKSLITAFETVDKTFKYSGPGALKRLSKLQKMVNEVRTVSPDAAKTTTALDGLWKCKALFSNLDQLSTDSVQNFIQLEGIDTSFDNMRKPVDEFVKVWNNAETIKQLNDVSGLFVVGNDDAVLNKTIETLRNSKEMRKLHGVMGDAEKAFSHVTTHSENIKKQVELIMNNSVVDTYIGSLTNYQPLFKCLHDFGPEKAYLVASVIGISRKFRTAKRNGKVVEDGEKVIDGVLKAIGTFGGLENALGKMKGVRTTDSDALRAFPEPEKHSEAFGRATQGIRAMKQLLDEKQKADVVIQSAGIIETQLASVSLDQEDVDNLKAMIQLSGALSTMYQKLAEWKNQNVDESSTVLVSYSPLFSSAQNVPGVGGNLWKMSSSVEKLASKVTEPTVQRQLKKVQTALFTLASIGIDFSTYTASFTNAKDSLTALDTFFVNHRKTVPPVTPPVASNSPVAQPSHQTIGLESTSTWVYVVLFLVAIVVSFILFVIEVIITLTLYKTKKRVFPKRQPCCLERFINQLVRALRSSSKPRKVKDVELLPVALMDFYTDFCFSLAAIRVKQGKTKDEDCFEPMMQNIFPCLKTANELWKTGQNEDEAPECRLDVEFEMVLDKSAYVALKKHKRRFETNFFNANQLEFENDLRFILARSPYFCLHKSISAVDQFWWMAMSSRCEFIVSFVTKDDMKEDGGECAPYYADFEGGKLELDGLTVSCLKRSEDSVNVVTTRLRVKFDGMAPYEMEHIHYTAWKQDSAPRTPDEVLEILKRVRLSDTPVIVHSPLGRGRAGTFAFIEYCYQHVCDYGKLPIADTLLKLRKVRAGAVVNDFQLAFAIVALVEWVRQGESLGQLFKLAIAFSKWHDRMSNETHQYPPDEKHDLHLSWYRKFVGFELHLRWLLANGYPLIMGNVVLVGPQTKSQRRFYSQVELYTKSEMKKERKETPPQEGESLKRIMAARKEDDVTIMEYLLYERKLLNDIHKLFK